MKRKTITRADAFVLLKQNGTHKLKVWTLKGGLRLYRDAVFLSHSPRHRTTKVRLKTSAEIHEFRNFCLHEIDDLEILM